MGENKRILQPIHSKVKRLDCPTKPVVIDFTVNTNKKYDDLPRIICQAMLRRKFVDSKVRTHSLITSLDIGVYPSGVRGKWLSSYLTLLQGVLHNSCSY